MVYIATQKTAQITQYYFQGLPGKALGVCISSKLHKLDIEKFLEYIPVRNGFAMNFYPPEYSEAQILKEEEMLADTVQFILDNELESRALNWYL